MPPDSAHLDRCFEPARLGTLTLRNRLIKAATYENSSPGGLPDQGYAALHERVANGGIGMTTLAYCAASPDGRLYDDTLVMNSGVAQQLSELIGRIKSRGAAVSGQLTHAGAFTSVAPGWFSKGASRGINLLGTTAGKPFSSAMTSREIDSLVEDFRSAAGVMKQAGFDAIELHFGHGYGLCQFISPLTNHRSDEYGGNLENRMRLPLRVLAAVREVVGTDTPILGKITLDEGVPGGIRPEEATKVARYLDDNGIDAVIPSTGSSAFSPMLMFRGDSPLPGMLAHESSILNRALYRLASPLMFRPRPYQELYLLDEARRLKDTLNCQVVYIGGASRRESIVTLMKAGFDFVQLGRALLSNPGLPGQWQRGEKETNLCIHCNDCIGSIRGELPTHCPRYPGTTTD